METAEVLETPQIDRIPILKERALRGIDEVCIDRARLITEGYKNAAADPIIVRRAKALANVLNNMTVRIFDQELIVGDQTVSHQAGHNYPEFGRWGSVASETQKVPTQDKEQHQNLSLLPKAAANASSVLPGHSIHQIKHLNDGLYNNQHSWISNGEPSWAEIDLGDIHTVSKVGFGSEHSQHHNDRAATKFDILVSTDYHEDSAHDSWQKVYEYQGSPVQKTTEFSFEPVDARWVRIHIYETAGGNVRIDEIEIYGDLMAEESSTEVLEESQKEKSLNDDVAEIAEFWEANPRLRATGSLFGHTVPGFEKIMKLGFDGIRAEAQAKLENLDDTNAEELSKEPFWQAMTIICEAAGNFGKRYAQLARDMAQGEDNPLAPTTPCPPLVRGIKGEYSRRKSELLQIADVCEQVPHSPARTFHEALQVLWFGHMMIELEDPPNAHSIGRIDQMLYPYYKRDMEEGILTREQALELMKCFGLKIWKSYDVQDTMLGGMKSDGTDGANDVSLLYLDAVEELDLHLQISARYHNNTDKAFWHRVAEVNSKCRGLPQMFSDETIIPALVKKGIPLEEARDYAIIGCIEVTIPGRCDPRVVNHYTNLAKCLELALNDGVCMLSGQQVGVKTGDPATFGKPKASVASCTSYEDVLEAYKAQVAYDVRAAVPRMHKAELEQRERFPMPILSVLTDDCIEKGIDITAGGARYNSTGVCGYGMANVGDSLAVIKKLVFEEDRLNLMDIIEGMRTNFEGNESLRQMLLNEAPKYGNDDDYVDSIVVELCRHFCEELEQYRNPRGGKYHAHLFSFVAAVGGGAGTAALPDGRLAREPVANSLAPQQGRDKEGITAMLKSAGKIDQTLAAAGTSLIFDLHPSILSGDNGDGVDKLESLLTTYLSIGGGHVECNIVDEKILRAAQKEPEKYQNISVRVAGYSAYFVNLAPDMQEHIIQKTKNRM